MRAPVFLFLHDVNEAALEKGLASIRRGYEGSVAKGRITQGAL